MLVTFFPVLLREVVVFAEQYDGEPHVTASLLAACDRAEELADEHGCIATSPCRG